MTTTSVYSDLNPDIGNSPLGEIVYDIDAINSSIENILGTKVGERWFYPDFGSHIGSVLFDPMTQTTVTRLRMEIIAAISTWEPRVNIISCVVTADYDNQFYAVTITWRFKKLNQVNRFSASLQRL